MQTTLHFMPLISDNMLFILGCLSLLGVVLSSLIFRRSLLWRAIAIAALFLIMANPVLLQEERKNSKDTAVVVVDRSDSQKVQERNTKTEAALSYIKDTLHLQHDINVRIIEAGKNEPDKKQETHLFDELDQQLSDIPQKQRAGVIFLTDGQVHDIPKNSEQFDKYGPVHVLLSGSKHEKDRQLTLLQVPSYGIVGQKTTIRFKVTDSPAESKEETSQLTISVPGQDPVTQQITINEEQSFDYRIDHAGQNILELSVEEMDGELSTANNKAALVINGVRDRLKVLLISGQPYVGERTWRNLLNADPGVDLVHFTILRSPDTQNFVPQHEMSLIRFPFQELFEQKINDFDLIIFDRYRLNGIMPHFYFRNIANYVKNGGAFLISNGPDYVSEHSVFETDLKDILPLAPSGTVFDTPFQPTLTDLGRRHPVTADLPTPENWGKWMRQIGTYYKRGDILMTGVDGQPLLVLDRAGKGRVAHLASDQVWLWARGYEGGGPYADLLRHIAHWLMKEPALEETALHLTVQGKQIFVKAHALYENEADNPVTVTKPDGSTEELTLKTTEKGWQEAYYTGEDIGVYSFNNGKQTHYAVIGTLNPPELLDLVSTKEKFLPIVKTSKGSIHWLEDTPTPAIRALDKGHSSFGGRNWIGLRQNNDYTVTAFKEIPLLPEWLSLCILVFLITFSWWKEGRSR